jgi:hypothetical protein
MLVLEAVVDGPLGQVLAVAVVVATLAVAVQVALVFLVELVAVVVDLDLLQVRVYYLEVLVQLLEIAPQENVQPMLAVLEQPIIPLGITVP